MEGTCGDGRAVYFRGRLFVIGVHNICYVHAITIASKKMSRRQSRRTREASFRCLGTSDEACIESSPDLDLMPLRLFSQGVYRPGGANIRLTCSVVVAGSN